MTTYTWKFDPLTCYTHKNGYDMVVLLIHWQLTAHNDEHYAQFIGVQTLTSHTICNNFIPFDFITEDMVHQWVIDSLGEHTISNIMELLQEQLSNETDVNHSWECTDYNIQTTLPQYEGTFVTVAPPWIKNIPYHYN
jgi:hypothetical protein